MAKIRINYHSNTIEISEAFAKKASVISSEAHSELNDVKKNYPTYRIIVVKKATRKTQIKGITKEFLRNYIEKQNDTVFLKEFDELVKNKTSFFEIKARFVNQYPQFKNYKTKADWILAA